MRLIDSSVRRYANTPIKWLLLLLFAGAGYRRYNAPVGGKTRLMKMMFLLERRFRHLITPSHDFVAYKYGPHSFEVQREIEDLKRNKLVQSFEDTKGETFYLTPEGVIMANEIALSTDVKAMAAIRNIKSRYNNMSLNALLHVVYEQYPDMAKESEWEPIE